MGLTLKSSAFENNDEIPEEYGYTKENINPPLSVSEVPPGTKTLALVMDDPDAEPVAGKIWDHWVVWNINPEISEIPEDWDQKGSMVGKNDYGEKGYGGPNPPDKNTYIDLS